MMGNWKELAKKKEKPKMVTASGHTFKDVGDKLNYGIFHPDTGDKLLGWIRKYCVDRKE